MPFIKLSHATTAEPTASDFFVNVDYIMRIVPREEGSTLLMHDGSSLAVQQAPDTIADYVDQLEAGGALQKSMSAANNSRSQLAAG